MGKRPAGEEFINVPVRFHAVARVSASFRDAVISVAESYSDFDERLSAAFLSQLNVLAMRAGISLNGVLENAFIEVCQSLGLIKKDADPATVCAADVVDADAGGVDSPGEQRKACFGHPTDFSVCSSCALLVECTRCCSPLPR